MSEEAAVNMETISTSILTDKQRFVFGERSITGFESRKSILVVDDSEGLREFLSILLHEEGTVYTAVNGFDALSKFAGNHFDIVVSDIEMPVMNGIELYKNVAPVYKDLFLFFSGTMNEEYINYLSMNNLMLFRKPDDILKLRPAVQQKLQKYFLDGVTN
jgi:DNA-binding NtrC family response regulator